MKQTIKKIIRNVKSIKGNSLAEFATTTALMATLAATAAPKLSEMSEGTKAEKSRNEIDKIIKQAGQFYQDKADLEGRGRFPGQTKYNVQVGGASYDNTDATSAGTTTALDSTWIGGVTWPQARKCGQHLSRCRHRCRHCRQPLEMARLPSA